MSLWQETERKHDQMLKIRLTEEERCNLEYIARTDKLNLSDKIRQLIWEDYKKKLEEE